MIGLLSHANASSSYPAALKCEHVPLQPVELQPSTWNDVQLGSSAHVLAHSSRPRTLVMGHTLIELAELRLPGKKLCDASLPSMRQQPFPTNRHSAFSVASVRLKTNPAIRSIEDCEDFIDWNEGG